MLTAMLFSGAVPVFDKVAVIAPEVVAVSVLGNVTACVSEAIGAIPVPVRLPVCGDPLALSATDSIAEKLAAEAGANVM
jgi:hypothetical protein